MPNIIGNSDALVKVSRATWKPAAFDHRVQFTALVPMRFLGQHRVVAAQRLERRDVHHEVPAGCQDPVELGEHLSPDVGHEALQDVEARDHVEGVVAKRHLHDAGLCEPLRAVVLGELQPGPRQVETVRGAVLREHRQVDAGTAAAVEQPPSAGGPRRRARRAAPRTRESP